MNHLRIGHLSTAYHSNFILMGTPWVKEKLGVQAEWCLFPTGPAMIDAFSKGELDIGYIGLPPAMIGIAKGLDIKCVGGGHVEGTVVTAIPGYRTLDEVGSIQATLDQFRDKIIGTPSRGSIHDVIIRQLVAEAGLQDDVTIKNYEWADFILEAMEDHEVAGGCGTPPLAILAQRFLDAPLILPSRAIWPYNPSYGIVAKLGLITGSPGIVKGFLQLHEDACNLIRGQPKKAAEIASNEIGIIDEEFLEEVYRVSPKYCASLPPEYIKSTLAFVPVLKKMGYISQPLSKKDIFNTKLVERVHTEKHHYDNPGKLG